MSGHNGEEPFFADIDAEQAVLGACMDSPEVTMQVRERLAGPEDFHEPAHRVVFRALADLATSGRPTDPIALKDHLSEHDQLDRHQLGHLGGALYLHTLYAAGSPPPVVEHHADIVAKHAERRRAWMEKTRLEQSLRNPAVSTAEALERLRSGIEQARRPVAERSGSVVGIELREFLSSVPPDPEWLVPGLLERRDRLILTGPEGGGKSTFLRQLGVQLASGVHPFGGQDFPPVRVLLYDLENSERQVYPKLSGLLAAAGNRYAGGLVVAVRGEGLDLANGDASALLAEVEHAKPDVLITGPAYKMVAGDPTEEGPARLVADQLDKIRMRYGCAVLLEAHSPHASNGGKRPERPYGASLWLRWPEFGLHLGEKGELKHWRGPREERDWPAMLERGGPWPWSPVTRPRDVLWARIVDHCGRCLTRPSLRELATALDTSKASIERAIAEHRTEWDAMREGP